MMTVTYEPVLMRDILASRSHRDPERIDDVLTRWLDRKARQQGLVLNLPSRRWYTLHDFRGHREVLVAEAYAFPWTNALEASFLRHIA